MIMSMTNYTIQEVVMNYANPYIVTTGASTSLVQCILAILTFQKRVERSQRSDHGHRYGNTRCSQPNPSAHFRA